MAWDHLSITSAHLVYIILGGFTSIFMLCSSFIKERMYIGEATVATLCGIIFGPHAANLIDPKSWGNVDLITLEFSRIVLVVQCFAVGVELPKFYMEKHWRSVILLLLPVMTFGWLVVSLFVWWAVPAISWLDSLVVAACVTATDPVLASSVVGKGKFAKRVPKHLRDLLSAESGCNDGMAFPFVYLGIYLIQEHMDARKTTYHWFVYTILYECIFGAIFGFTVGYIARHAIRVAEKRDLIDRESFLVFYFVLALFCAGAGSMLGMDDLLVGFAAGVGFSNDGWFHAKTEESHVSNVIDLLINLAYFVFLGTIIPWEQYNNIAGGLTAWRLVVLAILVIFFRRIPIMLALKPFIPDIKTWREALFAGHFGPIGVGAIFIAILARAELAYETAVPLSDTPPTDIPHYTVVALIWPITTFLVITSIIIHGSSIAVFTLGKRINTLSLTMSYTTSPEDGPTWMNRLPRISSQSRSQARSVSEEDELKMPDFPPGTLPPVGVTGQFLRRQKEGENVKQGSRSSSAHRRRRKSRDYGVGPGGPVSQSAIFPSTRQSSMEPSTHGKDSTTDSTPQTLVEGDADRYDEKMEHHPSRQESPQEEDEQINIYEEGSHIVVENRDGDVLALEPSNSRGKAVSDDAEAAARPAPAQRSGSIVNWTNFKQTVSGVYRDEMEKRKVKSDPKHAPARAYQFGNTIVIEDEAGEVIKTYELPTDKQKDGPDLLQQCQRYLGLGGSSDKAPVTPGTEGEPSAPAEGLFKKGWLFGGTSGNKAAAQELAEDKQVRFTIGGAGKRMTKDDFIKEMRKLDPKTRHDVVEQSSAPPAVKTLAKQTGNASGGDEKQPERQRQQPQLPEEAGESSGEASSSTGSEKRREAAVTDEPLRPVKILDDADGEPETPAERKRRLAALGTTAGDDSDDEGDPRVPPVKRGIRFADGAGQRRGGR
ncbi:Superoxide dismutase [Mn], mitochondrial [Verticillium nonalfalfae]|uniref:Superoxide dismutase [Mn], mitochondrial n=1 Tax=Verticillium nonalfalfae TaxID=1051616 RepID=A0A3M9YI17_9PEZI|nr:Superoxide dismutase [Mn], mitochondrial [Verticillium nonalfalfae]RNJ59701.1 Superoxide dismutase [Mn], mitochondrial [Verticillium nonalfalfae]